MRLLHTADWHLGKIVNEYSMIEDQRHYLHQLIETIKPLELDVFILAGDLYDRSLPSKEAVALADEILTKIVAELKIPVLVIAGNHDSQERLQYGSQLFTHTQLYMEGTLKTATTKVTIKDANFYLVPFADPAQARETLQNPAIRTMEDMARHQIEAIKADWDPDKLNILIGHGYVINGNVESVETSESERPLTIGTAEYIPVELLEDFDYVALGHLHMAQKVKHDRIRYSGSILKYSKSECRHKKQSLLVDLAKDSVKVESIIQEPLRDLRTIRGTFAEIMQGSSADYVFFELEDEGVIFDPMNQLRRRYPFAMGLEYVNRTQAVRSTLSHTQADLQQKTLPELFADFYQRSTEADLNEQEKETVLQAFAEAERSYHETH